MRVLSTNGVASFTSSSTEYSNTPLPDPFLGPSGGMYVFWDDLVAPFGAVRQAVVGTRPNRRFAVEWDDVSMFGGGGAISFEIVLHERDGSIVFRSRPGRRSWSWSRSQRR